MEGDAVDDADEQEGPVGAGFGLGRGGVVVYGEEDVRCASEVAEGGSDGCGVGSEFEELRHGGPEEDDVGIRVVHEDFTFEVSEIISQSMGLEGNQIGTASPCVLFPELDDLEKDY